MAQPNIDRAIAQVRAETDPYVALATANLLLRKAQNPEEVEALLREINRLTAVILNSGGDL